MPKIRVVIAEDHAVVRQGLKILIHADPDLCVAGEAEDGQTAIRLAEELQPDVVVMDLAMPKVNGLEATREILRNRPNCKVLVLSSYADDESVQTLMDAGASGYITKHSASDDLLQAIRHVHGGKQYFSPKIVQRMKRRARTLFARGMAKATDLSGREQQVLTLIAEGLATKEIAGRLELSSKTVEKHRQSVMDKLDIHDIAGLTRYAAGKGLVRLNGLGIAEGIQSVA